MSDAIKAAFFKWCDEHTAFMRANGENIAADASRSMMDFEAGYRSALAAREAVAVPDVPRCKKCGTHEVALLLECHNSSCEGYATQVSLYEGWKQPAASVPDGAAVAAEYLEAKRVIDAGPPRPEGSFAAPRSWRHNDPEVIRFHAAVAALNALAARVVTNG